MGKLDAAQRKRIPASEFGLPAKKGADGENKAGRGAYPMPNKAHARDAKARASEEANKGKLSRASEAQIDRKANRILGEKGAARKEVRR